MPKAQIDGMDFLGTFIDTLEKDTEALIKRGLYPAAGVIYGEVKRRISALPETTKEKPTKELTPAQKEGLLSSLYGSKFQRQDDGVYFVISVTGYNEHPTEAHPKGQPNIMILRSLERGTLHLHKHPVMRQSLNAMKKNAIEVMQKTISNDVQKLEKG